MNQKSWCKEIIWNTEFGHFGKKFEENILNGAKHVILETENNWLRENRLTFAYIHHKTWSTDYFRISACLYLSILLGFVLSCECIVILCQLNWVVRCVFYLAWMTTHSYHISFYLCMPYFLYLSMYLSIYP